MPPPRLRASSAAPELATVDPPAPAAIDPVAGETDDAGVPGVALELPDGPAERGPEDARALDAPPPEVAGTDGLGTEIVGNDGFGNDGVDTVGAGSDGVLTVGTGTDGVVTDGVTGVEGTVTEGTVTEGTVTEGTVSAALAWPTR